MLQHRVPAEPATQDTVKAIGDAARLAELLGHLGDPAPKFAIVTP
ncbi:alkyl sulfatase C-terminal domain-containing protein [Streptomyces sp. NPDC051658]